MRIQDSEPGRQIRGLRDNRGFLWRYDRARDAAIPFRFFYAPSFLEGLAGDCIDAVIDAHELSGIGLVGHDYLRSAMLAPSFSSIVLSAFLASP
jgi:hypothetical protein